MWLLSLGVDNDSIHYFFNFLQKLKLWQKYGLTVNCVCVDKKISSDKYLKQFLLILYVHRT